MMAIGGYDGSKFPHQNLAFPLATHLIASIIGNGNSNISVDIPNVPGPAVGSRTSTPGSGLEIDATGKVHGQLPKSVPKQWTREQLEDSASALRQSIANRKLELIRLGEHGAHRARIGQEERLLRQIEKVLSGS
jgi:hypothetical protein